MRVKDPSRAIPVKSKTHTKTNQHQDDDSSDDITGLTCQHVSQAVDVHNVKRAVAQNVWSICSECLKERRICDGEPVMPSDIWLCLKCGTQGCSQNSEGQHSLKHFQNALEEPHCIVINLSTWIVWCYECNEELSTHCNKKALAQIVDFLQRHVTRNESSSSSKIIWLHGENNEASDILKGKGISSSWASVPVKGINNLGNTCFFNAVMQNMAQTHLLNELMCEVKEKGTKLKIGQSPASQLEPLVVNLSSPGPLTSAMFLFLHSMKETGKGPLSPKVLFSQLCQKAPRFKGFQQQDSQEVLHYLLDAMRIEETKRIQAAILKAFNNPTTKTADEETKRKVKAYGREGVKMNFIDRIFVGELTSTIMCEECENISTVKEPFIDLSLPIIEERISKPVPFGRTSRGKHIQEADVEYNCSSVTALNNQQSKLSRKHLLTKDKNQENHERRFAKKSSSAEEDTRHFIMHKKVRNTKGEGRSAVPYTGDSSSVMESAANGSQTEGSEKEASHSESSIGADSEASESESHSKQTASSRACSTPGLCTDEHKHLSASIKSQCNKSSDGGIEGLTTGLSNLCLGSGVSETEGTLSRDQLSSLSNNIDGSAENPTLLQNPQNAFQTLSQCYITSSKECSVQSCLYQFTYVELLMGNNKLLCENCTERKQKHQKKGNFTEKKIEGVYTNARKQLLISSVPAVLVLHLKRFHQAGMSLRKVNRHVDFPLVLDLAPFCSASCKNVADGGKVLYSLYGIVEHSGSMRGGHYAAYVKVRAPSKKILEHISSNRNVQGLKDSVGATVGQWVYVSDTHVQAVTESRVLNSQAYLLFYERIL
ncbi:ubiquitin carboxyl-terminal hydrolase 45 [Podarcis raffonei]|uniref:ubiquitin carboxyl-terminal hydrolase 45 n=1 Tax=Podarcis raffonei TaxID=65483 RepID=UPI00232967ED|nr:ubiquitin carboxyl-terminal hydrolase 45 [Podarcis raffonei]XP_053237504.1 ubiquitin carboxyl-terminal hydrolase 45 [Podarcis raffonei]XP_053237505.1 ubiquitin carboxyl-terminal hydrolase 45 [Podarcis raffonei]XP_053237506.1 ubiquitin carboxyl-terminal hydrolase 45 [Podarcis raffonei]